MLISTPFNLIDVRACQLIFQRPKIPYVKNIPQDDVLPHKEPIFYAPLVIIEVVEFAWVGDRVMIRHISHFLLFSIYLKLKTQKPRTTP